MDNAVQAIIMAFSAIVFVIATSLAMFMLNKISTTSQYLLYAADKTNYYDNIESSGDNQLDRYVDADTIISTLYRYYKEDFCVKICDATDATNVKLLQIFDVNLEGKVRQAASVTDNKKTKEQKALNGLYNKKPISNADKASSPYLFEAPWIGNTDSNIKQRIDLYISGKAAYINNTYVDYTQNNFKKYLDGNYKFKETFIEYVFDGDTFTNDEGEILVNGQKQTSKIIITYSIMNNP